MKAAMISRSIVLASMMVLPLPCVIPAGEGKSPRRPVSFCQKCESPSQSQVSSDPSKPPNAWRGLIPLHSTRAEVEQVLGKPKWSHGFTFIHETECERVDVIYSKGACELTGSARWNVPADVVIKLEVAPRTKLFVKDLKLDLNRYLRDQESHPADWVQYRSLDDGIRVQALLDGKKEIVTVITYESRAKDKVLRCPTSKQD